MVLMTKAEEPCFLLRFLPKVISDHAQKCIMKMTINVNKHWKKKGVVWNLFINQFCWMR